MTVLNCQSPGASLGLSALGFAVAWWLDSVQAYHAIQMTFLVPLWVVSGAMFPAAGAPRGFAWAMALNPMAYAVAAVRRALYGGALPTPVLAGLGGSAGAGPGAALVVLGLFAVAALLLAGLTCRR